MIKEFAEHHMKTEQIKIDPELSQEVWKRGIRSPPRKIRVRMSKTEDGYVMVSPYEDDVKPKEDKPKKSDKKAETKEDTKPEVEAKDAKAEKPEPKKAEAKGKKADTKKKSAKKPAKKSK